MTTLAGLISPPPHYTREQKYLIGCIVDELWASVLVGNPCEDVRRRYRRMSTPRPGDLVVETSTLTTLLNDRDFSQDAWDGQFLTYVSSPRAGEWICLKPDGYAFHWTNASLIAVPSCWKWSRGGLA